MNFYKILNEKENHHGLQYHDGLNEDPLPFRPYGYCEPGGIYFAREDILAFLDYGPWIRKVTLPEGEPVYENPGLPKKWKAKRVILGPRRRINLQVIKELVEEGADIHVNLEFPLRWAVMNGHLDIVKYLVEEGADIHVFNDCALKLAAELGYLDIVKYLVEQGANIHARDDAALRWAAFYGKFDVVKYLVEQGANIHADNDGPLRWAAANGHLDEVKYLVEQGANIHANNDEALRQAITNNHFDVVRFLENFTKQSNKHKHSNSLI